jgi:23S rRNA A2030 N6-methylase RlmJ
MLKLPTEEVIHVLSSVSKLQLANICAVWYPLKCKKEQFDFIQQIIYTSQYIKFAKLAHIAILGLNICWKLLEVMVI